MWLDEFEQLGNEGGIVGLLLCHSPLLFNRQYIEVAKTFWYMVENDTNKDEHNNPCIVFLLYSVQVAIKFLCSG